MAEVVSIGELEGAVTGTVPAERVPISKEAFRAFYDRALPEVYRYLLARCGGVRSLADDLTQEVFIVAARSFESGTEPPIPWLIGVARNKLLEHARRSRREERRLARVYTAEEPEEIQFDAAGVSRDAVISALGGLSPLYRTVLALRYLDDLSVPEIASALGKSIHAAESILARARAAFRQEFVRLNDD